MTSGRIADETVAYRNLCFSILVLNHDWRPDQHYDKWDSWVGKIIDIRGNSPRNVCSYLSSATAKDVAHSPLSQDLGDRAMVLFREGHRRT
jgi:hypothetical protein